MRGHELTPSGYAQAIVAACLLNGYYEQGQQYLDKVMEDQNLRKYVPQDDIRVLRLKGFKIKDVK